MTRDLSLLSQIRASLGGRASLDLRQDAASALELASRRHLDGFIIDCDDLAGGAEALIKIRKGHSNRQTMIVAVVNGTTSIGGALELGANYVLSKPVQDARLQGVLDIAIPKMEREHRRYFRYESGVPVQFRNNAGRSFSTKMRNVSEGGLAAKRIETQTLDGVVFVEFNIPSILREPFHAKAELVWTDSFAMGLRFLYIEKESGIALQAWLSSLEAQSQFREMVLRP